VRRRLPSGISGPALLVCASLLLAACGDSRSTVPNLAAPVAPVAFRTVHFPSAGVTLQIPWTWVLVPGHGALVSTVSSGTAIVAIWRYRASAPPSGARALRGAERRLVQRATARDRGLRLIGARVTRVDGIPAVQIDAIEQIGGRQRRVRSTRVFRRHAQVVLEEYAPPNIFATEDRTVFARLEGSLLLTAVTTA
jgi:hypothetical protein